MSAAKTTAEKPKNKVIVLIFGPPRSGKTEIAKEIIDTLDGHDALEEEDLSVLTTNDAQAFEHVLETARDIGVES